MANAVTWLNCFPGAKARICSEGTFGLMPTPTCFTAPKREPAKKTPSGWLGAVRIVLLYGDAGGMWLQTALEATANVRIFGQYTMVSRDENHQFRELAAVKGRITPLAAPHQIPAKSLNAGI